MKRSAVIFNRFYLLFGILCIVYYLLCGITVRFGQSLLFLWPLLGLFCIGRWWLWKRAWAKGKSHPFPRWLLTAIRVVLLCCIAFFLYVESFVMSAAFAEPEPGLDAVIVLGARVNEDGPSGSLSERIHTAADYLQANPKVLAVASGGQGDDEPMSEAACIRNNLIALGVEPERILLEDRSTSTVENLTYSFALLEGKAQKVGLVTNDFHVFRAMCTGRKLGGFELSPVPARSFIGGFVHYSMREFFAICVSYLRGDLAFA